MEKLNLQYNVENKHSDKESSILYDQQLVHEFIDYANRLANGNIPMMMEVGNQFASKCNNKNILPYHQIFYALHGYFSGHLTETEEMMKELTQINWPSPEVQGYVEMLRGSNLRSLGALDQSVICLNKSLTLLQPKGKLEIGRSFAYYHLGGINMLFEDYGKAEKNLKLSLQSAEFTGHRTALFRSCLGLSHLYLKTDQIEEGDIYLNRASELAHDEATKAVALHEKSIYLLRIGQLGIALKLINECIEIRKNIQLNDAVNTALLTKVEILIASGIIEDAISIGTRVLKQIRKYKTRVKERDCLKVLSTAYKAAHNFETAFQYLEEYEQLNKDIIQKQYKEILTHKNTFITQQRNELFKQHQEIKASISYSKKLQAAILPSNKKMKACFFNHFILYLPKDIVAGDFYWMSSPDMRPDDSAHKEWTLFAVADCTGHGVPGAIVSFICSDLLNRAVNEFKLIEPSEILDKVTELIVQRFSMNDHHITDGMDISLAAFNQETHELKWSGANNSLLHVRNGELTDVRGDRQGIGYYKNIKPFTSRSIQIKADDLIYLGTDGYPDQFGGSRGKKMSQRVYKEKLLEIHELPIHHQKQELKRFLETWSGDEEQLDDICILGIKF